MTARRHTLQCFRQPVCIHSRIKSGAHDNPNVVICVHGVTRVSDDFDVLAQSCKRELSVICPDIVGRGQSGRLRNPWTIRCLNMSVIW